MATTHDNPAADRRLPKARRIANRRDFDRAFAARCSAADDRLIVYAVANGLRFTRVATVASVKLGGAVIRNRYKRLLREAFRLNQAALPAGYDFVLIPRPGGPAALADYAASLLRLSDRAVQKEKCRREPNP